MRFLESQLSIFFDLRMGRISLIVTLHQAVKLAKDTPLLRMGSNCELEENEVLKFTGPGSLQSWKKRVIMRRGLG
jgi:hypothetical protein